jgi:hypothetical protein
MAALSAIGTIAAIARHRTIVAARGEHQEEHDAMH